MPAASTLDEYLGLVTSAWRGKPDFAAVLSTILQPFVDAQKVLESIPAKFDVDVAQGQQLDFVGRWVGLSRTLNAPIDGVYFALDEAGVGLDEGYLAGVGDPTEGAIQLDDSTYRLMIYAKIAANMWDGTLAQAQKILASIFVSSPGTHVFIQDNADMSIDVGISGVLPSKLFQELISSGYFEVRGAAVRINDVFINPGPFFGFDTENYNISGLDVGVFT